MMLPQDCKQRLRLSAAARGRVDTERPVLQWPVVSALHGEKAPATFETGKEAFLFPFSSKIVKLTIELDIYSSQKEISTKKSL